jgi:hypothetical protein
VADFEIPLSITDTVMLLLPVEPTNDPVSWIRATALPEDPVTDVTVAETPGTEVDAEMVLVEVEITPVATT